MATSELAYFGLFIHYALCLSEISFSMYDLSSLPTLGLHCPLFTLNLPFAP